MACRETEARSSPVRRPFLPNAARLVRGIRTAFGEPTDDISAATTSRPQARPKPGMMEVLPSFNTACLIREPTARCIPVCNIPATTGPSLNTRACECCGFGRRLTSFFDTVRTLSMLGNVNLADIASHTDQEYRR
jgi:hypothetical protein